MFLRALTHPRRARPKFAVDGIDAAVDADRVRVWVACFLMASLGCAAWAAGCGGNEASGQSSSSGAGPGAGGAVHVCNGDMPDGFCNLLGNDPETCACADCTALAACDDRCVDDDVCNYHDDGTAEDCSCTDCLGKIDGCPPYGVGCSNDPGECSIAEDCTCPNCTNTPRCTDNCLNNGSCVEYLEGCSCADCMNVDSCGGSSGPGGGGGMGGMGGAGGMGASSSSSSASSASSASSSGMGGSAGGGGGDAG